jgi:hypothetical protein
MFMVYSFFIGATDTWQKRQKWPRELEQLHWSFRLEQLTGASGLELLDWSLGLELWSGALVWSSWTEYLDLFTGVLH